MNTKQEIAVDVDFFPHPYLGHKHERGTLVLSGDPLALFTEWWPRTSETDSDIGAVLADALDEHPQCAVESAPGLRDGVCKWLRDKFFSPD